MESDSKFRQQSNLGPEEVKPTVRSQKLKARVRRCYKRQEVKQEEQKGQVLGSCLGEFPMTELSVLPFNQFQGCLCAKISTIEEEEFVHFLQPCKHSNLIQERADFLEQEIIDIG